MDLINDLNKALTEAFNAPPRCKKMVLIAEAGCAPKVIFECYALDPKTPEGLKTLKSTFKVVPTIPKPCLKKE